MLNPVQIANLVRAAHEQRATMTQLATQDFSVLSHAQLVECCKVLCAATIASSAALAKVAEFFT